MIISRSVSWLLASLAMFAGTAAADELRPFTA